MSGTDPALVGQELSALLGELGTLGELVDVIAEEFTRPGRDQPLALGPVLEACRTAPFLSARRLVGARDADSLDAAAQRELAAYLAEPVGTSVLVLAFEERAAPAALRKAAARVGTVIDAAAPRGARARDEWFAGHLATTPLRFEREALETLKQHLGEDVARLEGVLGALVGAYGPGTHISVEALTPFLGSEGAVAPWDLTDAIDAGDITRAVHTLERLLAAGERHPLQVLASLHRHVGALLRLDGEETFGEREAADATGLSAFPAGKALRQARRLGHAGIAEAIILLAEADLDLRGRVGWPPELVLEVLVARLARGAHAGHGGARARTGHTRPAGRGASR